jgi:hypothetical protein
VALQSVFPWVPLNSKLVHTQAFPSGQLADADAVIDRLKASAEMSAMIIESFRMVFLTLVVDIGVFLDRTKFSQRWRMQSKKMD